LIDLPKCSTDIRDAAEGANEVWKLLGNYQTHAMGTNTIAADVSSFSNDNAYLSVFTGGDDHSVAFFQIFVRSGKVDGRLSVSDVPAIQVVPGASFSALKSLYFLCHAGRRYLFSVGYSQRLSCWRFSDEGSNNLPEMISSTPVDLGDVNCMAVNISSKHNSLEVWIAVCGMGVEMFRICQ
jgi:hypothetical protein